MHSIDVSYYIQRNYSSVEFSYMGDSCFLFCAFTWHIYANYYIHYVQAGIHPACHVLLGTELVLRHDWHWY